MMHAFILVNSCSTRGCRKKAAHTAAGRCGVETVQTSVHAGVRTTARVPALGRMGSQPVVTGSIVPHMIECCKFCHTFASTWH